MALKKILNHSLTAIVAVFIISLIFVPLQYFSIYSNWLIKTGIVLFIVTISMDLYYFVRDTPKRKWGKPKKQDSRRIFGIKRKIFFSSLQWAALLLLLFLILSIKDGKIGYAECPSTISGNVDANLAIKYFYSPFCPSCWKQEPILRDMLLSHGKSFSLERYDIRYCKEEVAKYRVMGTPSFVFILKNESKEFSSHGFIPKDTFESTVTNQDNLPMHR